MNIQLEYPRTLICEGPADQAFFRRLIQERNLSNFDIPDGQGRSYFSELLKGIRVGSRSKAILIVSDNDDDPIRSFREVQEQIRSATGYPVPEKPMEVARAAGQPAVLIMMVPGTGIKGCLETLLRTVWEREQPATKMCVDEFLNCTKVTKWEIQKRDKAAIQCFIASSNREDPTKSLRWYLVKTKNIPIPMDAPELNDITNTLRNFDTICGI